MSGPLAAILVLARGAPGGTRWAPGTSHQVGLEAPPSVCPFLPLPGDLKLNVSCSLASDSLQRHGL